MADVCIELAILPLLPDLKPTESTSPAYIAIERNLHEAGQQPGCQNVFWKVKEEDPDVVIMILTWDSLASHQQFQATPGYPAFCARLTALSSGPASMYHFDTPSPLPALTSPALEIVLAYFSAPLSRSLESSVPSAYQKFFDASEGATNELQAHASGWVVEDVEHERILGKGEKGKLFVGLFGWESVEGHLSYRATKTFQENIQGVRKSGHEGVEMFHVLLKQLK